MVTDLNGWTREGFEALPCREWNEDIVLFDSLIVLPAGDIHDSDLTPPLGLKDRYSYEI